MLKIVASIALLASVAMVQPALGEVKSKTIEYKVGNQTFKGHLAWDDALEGKRPGVLVIHEWWGLNDYARSRADQLAKLGYVAFACDMYGDGKTAEHPQDAGKMAGEVRMNVQEWRKRAVEALKVLKSQEQCDSSKVAAIGYCFGGSTALQLAYSGADLAAVSTFHAAIPVPTAEEAKQIKPTLQIHHGAQDNFITEETLQQFRQALDAAKKDWTLTYYAGAVHGFTVPGADDRGMPGLKYDEKADQRSWDAMLELFSDKEMGPQQQR